MSRVLIVEDEDAIAEIEKDYLELSGFEVVIKSDEQVVWQQHLRKILIL